jgi:hypothetical protein
MKPFKTQRLKLVLHKATIRALGTDELGHVNGGSTRPLGDPRPTVSIRCPTTRTVPGD